jgi:O-antigen/teichoic acid export membrane protein
LAAHDVNATQAARLGSRRPAIPPMIKNLFVVGFSSAFGLATTFLRGVLLARILGPAEFGLAVILISITGALDMFADAGIDRFVVQHRFGDRKDIMRTSHAFRVGGSTLIGGAIVLFAYPLSLVFKAPELAVPIALTGGVVTLRGFANLSYKLQQREHRFEQETIIDTARFSADVVTTAIVALITHSFWAVLAGSYMNALVHLAMSHLMARQAYSFRPRRQIISLVARFSTPIYINAAMLFAAVQGDRMVVAAMFSKPQLAFYAAACAIGQGVAGLSNRVTMSIMLPMLSPREVDIAARRKRTNDLGMLMIFLSLVFLLIMALAGPWAVKFLYGPAYGGLRNIIFASAIVQMIQLEQGWLTTLLMANGRTRSFPLITVMRATAFPAAVLFVSLGWSLLSIPLAFALGTAVSLAVSYYAAWPLKLISRRLVALSFGRIILATTMVGLLASSQ